MHKYPIGTIVTSTSGYYHKGMVVGYWGYIDKISYKPASKYKDIGEPILLIHPIEGSSGAILNRHGIVVFNSQGKDITKEIYTMYPRDTDLVGDLLENIITAKFPNRIKLKVKIPKANE